MKYCIANWKMNLTSKDGLVYLDKIGKKINEHNESFEKANHDNMLYIQLLDLLRRYEKNRKDGRFRHDNERCALDFENMTLMKEHIQVNISQNA